MNNLMKVAGIMFCAASISFIIAGCSEDDNSGTGPSALSAIGTWSMAKQTATNLNSGQVDVYVPAEENVAIMLMVKIDGTWISTHIDMTNGFTSTIEGTWDLSKGIIDRNGVEYSYSFSGGRLFTTSEMISYGDSIRLEEQWERVVIPLGDREIIGNWELDKATITNEDTGESGTLTKAELNIEYYYYTFNNDATFTSRMRIINGEEISKEGIYDAENKKIYGGGEFLSYELSGSKLYIMQYLESDEGRITLRWEFKKKY